MHPTDGVLLALLDEWTDPLEQHQLEEHVGRCERCRQQMARLARGRLVAGALLQDLQAPVPARSVEAIVRRARERRSRRRGLIAAAAGLLVASAAGASIRSGALHDVVRWFIPPPPPVEAPGPLEPPVAEAPTGIALEPTKDVQIEFAAVQAEGELRIVLGGDPRVTVTATEPVPYALRSGKVAVANAGARASYRVALPRDLERAAIRVAGRVIFAKWQSAIVTEATREGADSFRVALAERKDAP